MFNYKILVAVTYTIPSKNVLIHSLNRYLPNPVTCQTVCKVMETYKDEQDPVLALKLLSLGKRQTYTLKKNLKTLGKRKDVGRHSYYGRAK